MTKIRIQKYWLNKTFRDQWFSTFVDLKQSSLNSKTFELSIIPFQKRMYYTIYLFGEGIGSGGIGADRQGKPAFICLSHHTSFISSCFLHYPSKDLVATLPAPTPSWLRITALNGEWSVPSIWIKTHLSVWYKISCLLCWKSHLDHFSVLASNHKHALLTSDWNLLNNLEYLECYHCASAFEKCSRNYKDKIARYRRKGNSFAPEIVPKRGVLM